MGRSLLIALCLWSCILIVNCKFSNKAVKDVEIYIRKNIINDIWPTAPQVAFIVKLTQKDCRTNKNNPDLITGIQDDFFNAIKEEKDQHLAEMKDAMATNAIYSGVRILMATPKQVTEIKNGEYITYSEHAEYRLLTPEKKEGVSPVQDFMNKEPKAHGVIFYSLLSPCVDRCIKENNYFNILNSLESNFQKFNDRAFVYRIVYGTDQIKLDDIKKRQEVINAWGGLNKVMPLFRCTGGTCEQCFPSDEINEFCTKK